MRHHPSSFHRSPSLLTCVLFAVAVCGIAALAAAQCGNIKTVLNGGATGATRTQGAHRRALAFDAHKNLWSLVRRTVGATHQLILRRSTDGGSTWTASYNVPVANGTYGSIVTGSHCETLHVLWSANGTNGLSSVYYRAFDTDTQTWVGATQALALGVSANEQYYAQDIEVTSSGRVAVIYGNRAATPSSSPQFGYFAGAWSSTIRLAQHAAPGAHAFGPGKPIHTSVTAQNPNMQKVGEHIHIVFRAATGGYGIFYRGFRADVGANGAFTATTDTMIDPAGGATNVACLATDADCTQCHKELLYVIYSVGGTSPGTGRIMLAVTPALTATIASSWAQQTVIADAPLMGGNHSYHHYSLAVGEDEHVYAAFSLASQGHRRLYLRPYKQGFPQSSAFAVCSTIHANRFAWVNGFRNTQTTSDVYVSMSGHLNNINTGGYVGVYRRSNQARTVTYGPNCGDVPGLALSPRLASANTPTLNTTFKITGAGLPGSSPGFLTVGTQCYQTPIALSFPFVPGCWQHQNWQLFVPVSSDGCGRMLLPVNVPNNTALKGTHVFLQDLHRIGNGFQFVATNSMECLID